MSQNTWSLPTLGRLLRVKKDLALSTSSDKKPKPFAATAAGVDVTCINCGYSQGGQVVDRCPECGLVMSSLYRDPTHWHGSTAAPADWLRTACTIWRWDRRTQVRTSLIPATPDSRRFAKWSVIATAVVAGIGLATANATRQPSPAVSVLNFMLHLLLSTVVMGLFFTAIVFGLSLALSSTWRRRYKFIPASIHYATAWWPPATMALFPAALGYAFSPEAGALVFAGIAGAGGLFLWSMWLVAGVTASGSVPHAALRIALSCVVLAVVGNTLLWIIPGATRLAVTQIVASTESGLSRLRMFGTVKVDTRDRSPQTFALIIDAIQGSEDAMIRRRIEQLGAGDENQVVLFDDLCTLEQIKKALYALERDLRPQDKFILYINGHGAEYGAGAIKVWDGFITSQMLADHLSRMPTPHSLVIIDSCYGGKFLKPLREKTSSLVITASDDLNVAFASGLGGFWQALVQPGSDADGDSRVTVWEGFWAAYAKMLNDADSIRRRGLERLKPGSLMQRTLQENGYTTPQIDLFGEAGKQDFGVDVPKQRK